MFDWKASLEEAHEMASVGILSRWYSMVPTRARWWGRLSASSCYLAIELILLCDGMLVQGFAI